VSERLRFSRLAGAA